MKSCRVLISVASFWIALWILQLGSLASEIDFGITVEPYPLEDVLLPEVKLRIESLDQLIPNLWDPMDPSIDFRELLPELPGKHPKPSTPIFVFGGGQKGGDAIPPLTIENIEVEFYQPFDVGYIEYHPLDIPPEKTLMEDYGEIRGIVTYIPKAQVVITSATSKVFVMKEPGLQKGEAIAKPLPREVAKPVEKESPEGVGEIPTVEDEKKKRKGTAGELAIILIIGFVLIFLTPFKKLFTAIMLVFLWIYYWKPVASFFAKLLF